MLGEQQFCIRTLLVSEMIICGLDACRPYVEKFRVVSRWLGHGLLFSHLNFTLYSGLGVMCVDLG